MFELQLSWLDARHAICVAADISGVDHWLLLTFFQDCDHSTEIDLAPTEDGKYFDMIEIDPDDFWFNDKHYKLEKKA